jgi:5-methylcytosine-specific restriction endonuclease McrA
LDATSYSRLACAGCGQECALKYCSNVCKLRTWRSKNPEAYKAQRAKHEVRKVSAYFAGYCECGAPMGGRRERAKCNACEAKAVAATARAKAEALHRQDAKVIKCEECDCSFCPLYVMGRRSGTCSACSEARARAHKTAARLVRRAKERSAKVESVDPYRVFERDGWLCRLCGASTPRAKRGTYEDDAPELDHVVPIAKGGEHSYANTQCACRRCNGLKSDAMGWTPRGVVQSLEP